MTVMAALGVTVGVSALTITLSVMNGFESEVRQRIVGADAHIRIQSFHSNGITNADSIRHMVLRIPHVTGASPYVHVRGLLRYEKMTEGVELRGIDEQTEASVSDLPKQIIQGSLSVKREEGGIGGILLGNYLAERLGSAVGDTVTLLTTGGTIGWMPQMKRFAVRGIFSTGFFEYDNSIGFINLPEASTLAGLTDGAVTGLEVRLDQYDLAEAIAKVMKSKLTFPLYTLTWYEQNRTLFAWIQIEKWATFTILSLIILVAVVNIISSLVMLVLEKGRDIGILKAMGADEGGIAKIFLWEGLLIGASGSIIGSFIGFLFCWLQQTLGFFKLPGDVYFLDRMPIKMEWTDFLFVGVIAIVLSLLAAWYPARRASKLDPVAAIRGMG